MEFLQALSAQHPELAPQINEIHTSFSKKFPLLT